MIFKKFDIFEPPYDTCEVDLFSNIRILVTSGAIQPVAKNTNFWKEIHFTGVIGRSKNVENFKNYQNCV